MLQRADARRFRDRIRADVDNVAVAVLDRRRLEPGSECSDCADAAPR
jgi:hypothetical protein